MKHRIVAFSLSTLLAVGCTAGGPDAPAPSPPPPGPVATPAQQVLPASYDFGKVTSSNVPAPLEVTVGNTGNASLQVSNIALAAGTSPGFSLNLGGGSKPCGSASATIAAGDLCTVEVAFEPANTGVFTASLQIASNDRSSPVTSVPISGASEPVAALTVRINQIQTACPINGSNLVTAYVSVTDQGGYPVTGLIDANFTVTQGTTPGTLIPPVSYAEQTYQPIATAAALDFSSSLSNQSVAFGDMKSAFTSYFDAKRADDVGEVVKFGSEVEVTQPFTSDKAALLAAIALPFDKGGATKMYDAAFQSVGDTAAKSPLRKAVIVATDGADNASVRTLAEVAASATSQNVPIFTIGIGASINRTALEQLAADTGGLYYEANTSQNLATIYRQLSSILYERQYILKFDQLANGPGAASNVSIGVTKDALAGTATASVVSCN
jgi:Ca-activated chloride channel homolog